MRYFISLAQSCYCWPIWRTYSHPPVAHGSGYERTGVRQFTIFLENRVGRLTTLLRALEESDQCINAISVEESADTALVRLICSDPDDAPHHA